jgi:hypothetical protein
LEEAVLALDQETLVVLAAAVEVQLLERDLVELQLVVKVFLEV